MPSVRQDECTFWMTWAGVVWTKHRLLGSEVVSLF
jgi:hypothetical protein